MIWRYINLDYQEDRNENMKIFFNKNNLLHKRINAITPKDINIYTDKSFKNNLPICCLLSHLVAIKDFYDSNEEIGIICEDDLDWELFEKNNFKIDNIIKNAPQDWEILQLSYSLDNLNKKFFYQKYLDWKINYYSTMCYAINRKGAEKLLNKVFINEKLSKFNFKKMVADIVLYESVKTYTYYLSLFLTNLKFKSTLGNNNERLKKYNNILIKIYNHYGIKL